MKMLKKVAKKSAKKTAKKEAAKTTKAKKTTARKKSSNTYTPDEIYAMIKKNAYQLYENRGYSHGNDLSDWYAAEKNILGVIKK